MKKKNENTFFVILFFLKFKYRGPKLGNPKIGYDPTLIDFFFFKWFKIDFDRDTLIEVLFCYLSKIPQYQGIMLKCAVFPYVPVPGT